MQHLCNDAASKALNIVQSTPNDQKELDLSNLDLIKMSKGKYCGCWYSGPTPSTPAFPTTEPEHSQNLENSMKFHAKTRNTIKLMWRFTNAYSQRLRSRYKPKDK